MKTAIGIVTYGNAQFTRLGLVEIIKRVKDWRETICLVAGKPGDTDTVDLARTYGTEIIRHQENKGFPASINDLYDWAWGEGRFDNLIMMGNDVVPFPGAIDALINQAATTDYELIAGSELDARSLVERYPDARQHFAAIHERASRSDEVKFRAISSFAVASTSPVGEPLDSSPSSVGTWMECCARF